MLKPKFKKGDYIKLKEMDVAQIVLIREVDNDTGLYSLETIVSLFHKIPNFRNSTCAFIDDLYDKTNYIKYNEYWVKLNT